MLCCENFLSFLLCATTWNAKLEGISWIAGGNVVCLFVLYMTILSTWMPDERISQKWQIIVLGWGHYGTIITLHLTIPYHITITFFICCLWNWKDFQGHILEWTWKSCSIHWYLWLYGVLCNMMTEPQIQELLAVSGILFLIKHGNACQEFFYRSSWALTTQCENRGVHHLVRTPLGTESYFWRFPLSPPLFVFVFLVWLTCYNRMLLSYKEYLHTYTKSKENSLCLTVSWNQTYLDFTDSAGLLKIYLAVCTRPFGYNGQISS